MKVWKQKPSGAPKNDSGWDIVVELGSRRHVSYFSNPANSVDHAHLEYFKGRYPIINTNQKMEQFKRLYKNLWVTVTEKQRELMQHAVGLNYKSKPYRNRFFTQDTDKDWNELVEKGLAEKGKNRPNGDEFVYFWLTQQGVELVIDKSISDEKYKDL